MGKFMRHNITYTKIIIYFYINNKERSEVSGEENEIISSFNIM